MPAPQLEFDTKFLDMITEELATIASENSGAFDADDTESALHRALQRLTKS
jgi:hypothetical protein